MKIKLPTYTITTKPKEEHLDAHWDHRHNTHIIWKTYTEDIPTEHLHSHSTLNNSSKIPIIHAGSS